VRIAFLVGFPKPAEIRIKAQLLDCLADQKLIWVPQRSDRPPRTQAVYEAMAQPDHRFLQRELRRALSSKKDALVCIARAKQPFPEIDSVIEAECQNHGETLKVRRDIAAYDSKTAVEQLADWIGPTMIRPMPTADTIKQICGDSKIICVSYAQSDSFRTAFKNLGIAEPNYAAIATEVRAGSGYHALAQIEHLPDRSGPLLFSTAGLGGIPHQIREEFVGRLCTGPTVVEATLSFVEFIDAAWHRLELRKASEIQLKLLPSPSISREGLQAIARFVPCRLVSGDFYDWFDMENGGFAIAVADITGKGMGAAVTAHGVQQIIRTAMKRGESPAIAARRVHAELIRIPTNVELFCGSIDIQGRKLRYFYAGQVPPLLCRADGTIEKLCVTGTYLGHDLGQTFEDAEAEIVFDEGDRMVIYTDGVSAAGDPEPEGYIRGLGPTVGWDPAVIATTIVDRAQNSRSLDQRDEDDLTLVILSRT